MYLAELTCFQNHCLITLDQLYGYQFNDIENPVMQLRPSLKACSKQEWGRTFTNSRHTVMNSTKSYKSNCCEFLIWNNLISVPLCYHPIPWWRHQMETFSALLAICAENSPVPVEFPAQRPVTRSFDVLFDPGLNKQLSKQLWGWWFETLSCSLWCHCNDHGSGLFRAPYGTLQSLWWRCFSVSLMGMPA